MQTIAIERKSCSLTTIITLLSAATNVFPVIVMGKVRNWDRIVKQDKETSWIYSGPTPGGEEETYGIAVYRLGEKHDGPGYVWAVVVEDIDSGVVEDSAPIEWTLSGSAVTWDSRAEAEEAAVEEMRFINERKKEDRNFSIGEYYSWFGVTTPV